jgi:hypothetical protein
MHVSGYLIAVNIHNALIDVDGYWRDRSRPLQAAFLSGCGGGRKCDIEQFDWLV